MAGQAPTPAQARISPVLPGSTPEGMETPRTPVDDGSGSSEHREPVCGRICRPGIASLVLLRPKSSEYPWAQLPADSNSHALKLRGNSTPMKPDAAEPQLARGEVPVPCQQVEGELDV